MADGGGIHRVLAVAVVAIGLGGLLGWRSLRTGTPTRLGAAAGVPGDPHLAPLMPFTQPVADTARVVRLAQPRIVLARDPFGQATVSQLSDNSHDSAPADHSAEPSALHVTATMIAGSHRAAVINDVLVYVGDPVPGGGKLTAVERDHVVVTDPTGASRVVAVKEGSNQ